jgi:Fur family peroxide stress response transcriptional regulator
MEASLLDSRLTAELKARGQRVTMPRLMVHRFVAAAPRHVTAEDVHAELPSLSFATIYSTLDLLEDLRLVRRVSTPGAAVYDSRVDSHDHAVCRRCGRMFDVEPARVHPGPTPEGFQVEHAVVQLVGLCADCAAIAG